MKLLFIECLQAITATNVMIMHANKASNHCQSLIHPEALFSLSTPKSKSTHQNKGLQTFK